MKTFDGQIVYQHPLQRKHLKKSHGDQHGEEQEHDDEEEGLRAPAGDTPPVASMMQIRVAGISIEDELEEEQKKNEKVWNGMCFIWMLIC